MQQVIGLPTVEEIKSHVLQVLCAKDCLDPAQTPLTQSLLVRKGKPCGLFFQAHGPRLVKNYAVWAGDESRILFYDCNGERFAETRLTEAPDPRRLAA